MKENHQIIQWLALLTLLLAPTVAQAQFNYTDNGDGTATITGYTGTGSVVTIPGAINGLTVTIIGQDAFYFQSGLTSVTMPSSVTSIAEEAFAYCQGLTSVTIPNSVTSIGDYAFDYCTSMTNVTIGNGVTSIGAWAFEGCGLKGITIPGSVTSIGTDALGDCNSLASIAVNPQNANYSSLNGVLFNKNQTTLLQFPGGMGGSYAIPNGVISIGDFAFDDCPYLTSVAIPNSVTSIGNYAFEWCILTSVTIPNGVTNIGENAFSYCANLTSVTIGNGVTNIGIYAFYQCSSLTNFTIPNSITSIGGSAFAYCASLTSVTIPNSVTSIGGSAFAYCTSLTSVTIGSGITSIGDHAFIECTRLASVSIGNGLTNIGSFAFYDCGSLRSVFVTGNAPSSYDGTAFLTYSSHDPATIYFHSGTTGWNDFAHNNGVAAALWNPEILTSFGFGIQNNKFSFYITGPPNIPIVVQASTNLAGEAWTALQSCTLTNGFIHFNDPQWTNYPNRFYRISSP